MKKRFFQISIILLFVILLGGGMVGYSFSVPGYKGEKSDHFDGSKFFNKGNVTTEGLSGILKVVFTEERGKWEERKLQGSNVIPAMHNEENSVKITFVNHSTFLIQIGSLNILTDPVWAERVSPVSWAGPKRFIEPGILFENLPKIDLVLISHNHYDHLDISTVKKINKNFSPKFIVPLGNSVFLNQNGIDNSIDLDWWDEVKINTDTKITLVPAQHFSGRGLFDRDNTLWGGFVISYKDKNIYFAGDTGFGNFFEEIKNKFGEFELAIIPIGAYKPNWFMNPVHLNPEEAIKVHKIVKSKFSIASHFGTFPLAWDGMDEPVEEFNRLRIKQNLSSNEFEILENGQSITVKF